MSRPPPMADVRPDDTVRITGTASSPHGHRFVDLLAVVATVLNADGQRWLKVWPLEGQPDPDGSGKVWFPESGVESVEVIERAE